MKLTINTERTIVDPSQLSFGQAINSAPRSVKFWDFTAIGTRFYQRRKWGKDSYWYDTHSMIYVGDGVHHMVFEVTFPFARYRNLFPLDVDKIYQVHEFRHRRIVTKAEKQSVLTFTAGLHGKWYDVPDLLDFIILDTLGYDYASYTPIFGTRGRMVCSVGVMGSLISCWKEHWEKDGTPRPGGDQHVERTDPATFPNMHDSFQCLGNLEV